ncbi:DnaJ C terminal domain/DnaJ central domain containing protein, putative [Angomonas deanei]|uniref:DnaJ C terminal domain/DnaJ central domain containing protein, putative n=1 Tax=Angomonas deanei TaxID=59799 RepID=A0A7G2C651_9TRYP|nr:DnaJ C terminal domain/DnaJ central domain containing protein, putative [Angomonas deanei]
MLHKIRTHVLHDRSLLRHYSVFQKGHDKVQQSLFDILGFGKDSDEERASRTVDDLKRGLLSEALLLKDPEHNEEEKAKLETLKKAYAMLSDENFRRNYDSHHYSSNDAQLHVLVDGGKVAANFNPEYPSFSFLDHSKTLEDGELPQTSMGDYREAFKSATGIGASAQEARPFSAAEAKGALNGSDIHFQMNLKFEEGLLGCTKRTKYRKQVQCKVCSGEGSQTLKKRRKCPQCLGRGSTVLPSATYHVERRCSFCSGEGTVPPPPCSSCGGAGVTEQEVIVPVTVPPGMISGAIFRVPKRGHDGARGGRAGDLVLMVLVGEHRHFHQSGSHMHAMLPIPLSTALLGGIVTVPTLDGETAQLRVPACVRNGQLLSFRQYRTNQGAESPANPEHMSNDDILFHALIIIPKEAALSGKQKKALADYEVDAVPLLSEKETSSDEKGDLWEQCAQLKRQYKHWFEV